MTEQTTSELVQPAASAVKRRKPGKKFIIAVTAFLGVILASAGSAAAYYGYVLPNRPENIVAKALVSTMDRSELQSFNFDGSLQFSGPRAESEQIKSIAMSGAIADDGRMSARLDLDARAITPSVNVRIAQDKTIYASLEGLSELVSLVSLDQISPESVLKLSRLTGQIENSWFSIDSATLKQLGANADAATTPLTDAEVQSLAAVYKEHQFILIDQVLEDEIIDGVDSRHYRLVFEGQQLIDFLEAVQEKNIASLEFSSEQIATVRKWVEAGGAEQTPFDIWIDKSTGYLNKLEADATIDGMMAKLTMKLSNFNQASPETAPEGAQPVQSLFTTFLTLGMDQQFVGDLSRLYEEQVKPLVPSRPGN